MKVSDFYDDQYDDYLEDDEQRVIKVSKSMKDQDNKKHKKTFKPRRQNQKDSQKVNYNSFF